MSISRRVFCGGLLTSFIGVTANGSALANSVARMIVVRLDPKKVVRPTLTVYDDAMVPLRTCAVAARASVPLDIYGTVLLVERKGPWFPTPNIRANWLAKHGKELPSVVRFGDPLYPLGTGFIRIDWKTPGVRESNERHIGIHGTNQPEIITDQSTDPYVTSGCVRMLIPEWEWLSTIVVPGRTEVHLIPVGSSMLPTA